MTDQQFDKLKIGDVVTRSIGPNKGIPVRVIKKTEGIPGLFPSEITAVVYNSEDILHVGRKKEPSKVVTGASKGFKVLYIPKDVALLQRRHITDPTRKLTPAWEYYLKETDELEDNFDKRMAWNMMRLLTCDTFGVNRVADIPDEKVPDAIETAKKFIDLFVKCYKEESKQ